MQIRVVTIFPNFFDSCLGEGLLGKAAGKGLVRIEAVDLRAYADDKHRTVDDEPFGGGAGMVMKVDVWDRAIADARAALPGARVILLSPQGETLCEDVARRLAREKALVFCCGRYEGVDERVGAHLVDQELSIGDYVLTGGEAAALTAIDAIARKLPGVVGRSESVDTDTFTAGLKYPQYTRPATYKGWKTPAVLLGGDHRRIAQWRAEQAAKRTGERRPDLLGRVLAGRTRLALVDPPKALAALAQQAVTAYGLRELAVCVTDADKRAPWREKAQAPQRIYGPLADARRRWKDNRFVHLAAQAGPGQAAPGEIARQLVDETGEITLTWGISPPAGALIAAPVLEGQPHGIIALFAWLERFFGRG